MQLEPVYHLGKHAAICAVLETIGTPPARYVCPFCHTEQDHGIKRGKSGALLAICLTCGQGSRVVEDDQ